MPTSRVRYASYYHIWTTICKNDKPQVKGKANRRLDVSSDKTPGALSAYESTDYQIVFDEIKTLIASLNTKYILFSYNNKSKIKIDDLTDIFQKYNLIKMDSFAHKENVMKNCTSTQKWLGDSKENKEYLFLIRK